MLEIYTGKVILHTHLPMKMEQTEYSETSAYKIQTPGNYPEESIQHSQHGESLKSRILIHYLARLGIFFSLNCFNVKRPLMFSPKFGVFSSKWKIWVGCHQIQLSNIYTGIKRVLDPEA
jgi:hypothetical protein